MNVAKDPDAFRNFEYEGWQGAVDRYHESWSLVTRQTAGTVLDKLHVAEGCRFLDLGVRISSVGVTMLDLVWHPESAEAVFPAYLQGRARMGGLLRGQGPEARARIQRAVTEAARAYADAGGKITIPMPAVLARIAPV